MLKILQNNCKKIFHNISKYFKTIEYQKMSNFISNIFITMVTTSIFIVICSEKAKVKKFNF